MCVCLTLQVNGSLTSSLFNGSATFNNLRIHAAGSFRILVFLEGSHAPAECGLIDNRLNEILLAPHVATCFCGCPCSCPYPCPCPFSCPCPCPCPASVLCLCPCPCPCPRTCPCPCPCLCLLFVTVSVSRFSANVMRDYSQFQLITRSFYNSMADCFSLSAGVCLCA